LFIQKSLKIYISATRDGLTDEEVNERLEKVKEFH
jgi:hypothetical protein